MPTQAQMWAREPHQDDYEVSLMQKEAHDVELYKQKKESYNNLQFDIEEVDHCPLVILFGLTLLHKAML